MKAFFVIMCLGLIPGLILLTVCQQPQVKKEHIQNMNQSEQQLLRSLHQVERKIQDYYYSLKRPQTVTNAFILNQIMEKTVSFIFEQEGSNSKKSKIYPVQSVNYKSRNDQLFSIFLTDGNIYTTVDNQIVLKHQPSNQFLNKILYFGVRTEISLFANIQLSKQTRGGQQRTNITIFKASFKNKKNILQFELSFESVRNSSEYVDFVYCQAMNKRFYIFSTSTGELDFYQSRAGYMQYNLKVSTTQLPLHLKKLGNSLLAYSSKQIYTIHAVTKNVKVITCQLPYEQIIDIDVDDFHVKNFLVRSTNKLYSYEGFPNCKPTYSYNIPNQAQTFLIRENVFVFIQNTGFYYYINRTDHKIYHTSIPSTKCQQQANFTTPQQSFYILKKSYDQFVLCRFCSSERDLQSQLKQKRQVRLHTEYLSLQFEIQFQDDTDYSQMRIPLIICSFIFVIYLSVKRNRESPQEKQKNMEKQERIKMECQRLIQQLKKQEFGSSNSDLNLNSMGKEVKNAQKQIKKQRTMTKQDQVKEPNQKQQKQKQKKKKTFQKVK